MNTHRIVADERQEGSATSVPHHASIHGKMVGYASLTHPTLVLAPEDVLPGFTIFG